MDATWNLRSEHRPFPWLALGILLLAMLAVAWGTHAVLKHGDSALTARECLEQKGPVATLNNPVTHRTASVCEVDEGKYAVVVTEGDHEITSFIKDKMRRLEQVIRYLKNAGYQ